MKTMALNSVQNEKSTVMTSQLLANVMNTISKYEVNEDLAVLIVVICTLSILVGVAMMNTAVMVVAVLVLIVAFVPTVLRWIKEDYDREI